MSRQTCLSSHFSRILRLLLVSEEGAGNITDITKLSSMHSVTNRFQHLKTKLIEKSAQDYFGSKLLMPDEEILKVTKQLSNHYKVTHLLSMGNCASIVLVNLTAFRHFVFESRVQKSGTGSNKFVKWKGTFLVNRSKRTTFKAGPEYFGQSKPKWSFPFNVATKIAGILG